MKAVRIIIKQEMANYKTQMSFKLKETFPLPQYSTVIGLIHNSCDLKEYNEMQISIQGKYFSKTIDLYTKYEFANTKFENNAKYYKIIKDIGISKGVGKKEFLIDIELMIHIKADENLLDLIYNRFKRPTKYLSLGKHEDIISIKDVCFVDINKEESNRDIFLKNGYSAYIPLSLVDKDNKIIKEYNYLKDSIYLDTVKNSSKITNKGTEFLIAKDYCLENIGTKKNIKNIRRWNKVNVVYSSYVIGDSDFELLKDNDDNLVFFA